MFQRQPRVARVAVDKCIPNQGPIGWAYNGSPFPMVNQMDIIGTNDPVDCDFFGHVIDCFPFAFIPAVPLRLAVNFGLNRGVRDCDRAL